MHGATPPGVSPSATESRAITPPRAVAIAPSPKSPVNAGLHDEVVQLLMRDRELDSELQQLRSFPVLTLLGAHRWAARAQGSNAASPSPPRSAPGRFERMSAGERSPAAAASTASRIASLQDEVQQLRDALSTSQAALAAANDEIARLASQLRATMQEPTVQEATVQEATVQEATVQEATVQEATVQELAAVEPVSVSPRQLTGMRPFVPARQEWLSSEILVALTVLDDRLAAVLRSGDIRLVRSAWVLAQDPLTFRMPHRQELEAMEESGVSPSPLLSPEEAVELLRRGQRGVGVLSHAWLSPGHPDPAGKRMQVLRRALEQKLHIEASFFDFASLYQHPPGGMRTDEQQACFGRAIDVMGDLYASAIGTTILQIKEIPERPAEFHGALCLFTLAEGVDEAQIRTALKSFGAIEDCQLGGWPSAIVRFSTHEAALAAKRAAPFSICAGVDTLYNERSYDGRAGEAGGDNDEGRGWCCFESAVSGEVIWRLEAYPKMRDELDHLPPKMLSLSSDTEATPVELRVDHSKLDSRVGEVVESIQRATFTGSGDKEKVPQLYKDYVEKIASMLTKTLSLLPASFAAAQDAASLSPLPTVSAPPAAPLRCAAGQLVLMLPETSRAVGSEGGTSFGAVGERGRVSLILAGGEVALSYDACVQAVLPWSPANARSGWDAALLRDVRALPALSERASQLSRHAKALPSKTSVDRTQLKKLGKEAVGSLEAMAENRLLIEHSNRAAAAVRTSIDAAIKGISQLPAPPPEGGGPLESMQKALAGLQFEPEAVAAAALRRSGMLGLRRYAAGQWLFVQYRGKWRDASVLAAGSKHRMRIEGEGEASLDLHPWNHAPRELPLAAFDALNVWWAQSLRAQHAQVADALTGRSLDALQQCVAIKVTGDASLSGVRDVHGLSKWLHSLHSARSGGQAVTAPGAALLTAPPAAGKTTLISQAVLLALEKAELMPIVIKVQLLQAKLLDAPDAFASHWNWVDAYLRLVYYDEKPEVYRMLRQAMMARRALLLIDGLDEGGTNRTEIERHVAEVLEAQGHVMLCTSRPAGVDEARFAGFHRLKLAPLTEAQQEQALTQRLGVAGVEKLMPFVERMPNDSETGGRVTANPLMLSMVASVFEIRQGVDMPETVAKLYADASEAMLARGGGVSAELRTLLQAVLFEAHAAQARVITDVQLSRAALVVWGSPGTLAELEQQYPVNALPKYADRAEKGHYVEIVKEGGSNYVPEGLKGKRGVICEADNSSRPYRVKFANGGLSRYLYSTDLVSSGLDEAACLAQMAKAFDREHLPALQRAVDSQLSEAAKQAVEAMRERVRQDRLPLLSLLQVEPLQMQSSHLSFQEYFAVTAICSGECCLPKASPPPWQWPAFWANAVKLGGEMGEAFGKGLLKAAGVVGEELDLTKQLGGDRPTAVAAVAQLMHGLRSLDLSGNSISSSEEVVIAGALKTNATLTQLNLSSNELATKETDWFKTSEVSGASFEVGARVTYKGQPMVVTRSPDSGGDIRMRPADAETGVWAMAEALKTNATLTQLDMHGNNLGAESGRVMVEMLKVNATLTQLDMSSNDLGAEGGKAVAETLKANTTLIQLNLSSNKLVTKETSRVKTSEVSGASFEVGARVTYKGQPMVVTRSPDSGGDIRMRPADAETGVRAMAEALKTNATLTQLDMGNNELGPESGRVMVEMLKVNPRLTSIALDGAAFSIAQLSGAGRKLDLSKKKLGEASGVVIAHLLKVNTTLTQLDVGGNNLGPEGGKAMAEALKVNATLTQLDFGGNQLDVESGTELAAAVLSASSLTVFSGINLKTTDGQVFSGKAFAHFGLAEALVLSQRVLDIGPEHWKIDLRGIAKQETCDETTGWNTGKHGYGGGRWISSLDRSTVKTIASTLPKHMDEVVVLLDKAYITNFKTFGDVREAWMFGRGCAHCTGTMHEDGGVDHDSSETRGGIIASCQDDCKLCHEKVFWFEYEN